MRKVSAVDFSAPESAPALFSDRFQWLLKVLLSQRIGPQHLSAPREPPVSGSHLARISGTSTATACRFLQQLTDHGFIAKKCNQISLVRIDEILRLWRSHHSSLHPTPGLSTRFVVPQDDIDRSLARSLKGSPSSTILGFRSACGLHGLNDATATALPRCVYAPSESTLEHLGLMAVDAISTAEVYVRSPPAELHVRRAAVQVQGLLATDIIQTWLDVSAVDGLTDVADQLFLATLSSPLDLKSSP